MTEHRIVIQGGEAKAVYADGINDTLHALGEVRIERASHVEPHPTKPGWLADMTPSGGPYIGSNGEMRIEDLPPGQSVAMLLDGFTLREDALAAELAWLRKEKGL